MDNIQFWLYLVFGAIYLLTRFLKKKDPENEPNRPGQNPNQPQRPQRKPVTFEELLKEFTEGRQEEEEPERVPERRPMEETQVKERKRQEESRPKEIIEEGRTRRFADDESRRIYEESIRKAEDTAIEFRRDDDFRSRMARRNEEEAENNLAEEIKEMLQDKNQAQKAVVLSEILNRKY